jgi:adenylate kinase family enzyme
MIVRADVREKDIDMPRIVVVGTSCSGKTTLARKLATVLAVPHIELDVIHWGPGWTPAPIDEFRRAVANATNEDHWVADGNYSKVRDIVWRRATHVVWLNYPFLTVFSRALARTLRRALLREELFAGNRESLRQSFLSRESILWWIIHSHRRRQREFRQLIDDGSFPNLQYTELRTPAATKQFIMRIIEGEISL